MKYLETKHQKKSAIITVCLMGLLLLVMFFFGMQYLDPPEEYGIAINFGTSEVGNGRPKVQETIKSSPEPAQPKQEVVKELVTPVKEVKEDVLTQKEVEAPVVQKEIPKKKTVVAKTTPKEVVKKVVKKEAPKPSKETQNALSNLLNGKKSDGDPSKGEGDDAVSGLKGKIDGDPTSSKYYGNGGSGGDGNYNLSGRNPLSRPIIKPNCNEEGTVYVSIEVDKSGKVIKAVPGVKGTTNTAPCLLKPAKEAALKTKWNADGEAPVKQVGIIIYKFSLSE